MKTFRYLAKPTLIRSSAVLAGISALFVLVSLRYANPVEPTPTPKCPPSFQGTPRKQKSMLASPNIVGLYKIAHCLSLFVTNCA
jgi:hypothetical protein